MKFETSGIFAILIVLLLPLGMGQFVQKSTLPEYLPAVQLREALSGGAVSPHIAVAAALERVYASAMGLDAPSAQAIVGFLLVFPPVLLALCAALLYLACRQMAYTKMQSAFAASLFSLSLVAMLSFLPGVYGSGSLASVLFAAFLLLFAAYANKHENTVLLLPAALLGFGAGYVSAPFALAGAAVAIAFAFQAHRKGAKNSIMALGALVLVFAAAAFLSPDRALLAFSADSLATVATNASFLLAAASICIGLFFFGKRDAEFLALLLLAAAVCGFSPLAGALLLVLPAAEGISKAMADSASKEAKLAGAFLAAFFVVMGMMLPFGAYPAIAAGAMLGLLLPLTLHMYEYNASAFFSSMAAALFLLSALFGVFAQAASWPGYPSYTDAQLAEALSYLSGDGATNVATLERVDAVSFYLPSAAREKGAAVEDYLLAGKGSLQGGSYLLFSLPTLEELSAKGGFEVYYYAQNYTSNGASYALFVSRQGRLVSRELALGGKFALKDGAALDSYGRYYAPITLTRMAMLAGGKPIADKSNRLLVMDEGGAPPHIAAVYSGKDSAVKLDREFSGVAVYKVV